MAVRGVDEAGMGRQGVGLEGVKIQAVVDVYDSEIGVAKCSRTAVL